VTRAKNCELCTEIAAVVVEIHSLEGIGSVSFVGNIRTNISFLFILRPYYNYTFVCVFFVYPCIGFNNFQKTATECIFLILFKLFFINSTMTQHPNNYLNIGCAINIIFLKIF